MKFRTRKFDLANELGSLNAVVDRKSKDLIYQCVHLTQVDNLNLSLAAASSSEGLMLTSSIKIDGSAGGLLPPDPATNGAKSCAVDAGKLFDLCKKLPDKLIELDYDAEKLKLLVRCDSSRFTISCLEPTLFPSIRTPTTYSYKIPLRFFLNAVKHSLVMIEAKESAMVHYSGMLIILEDKVLEVIATDGHRMSVWFTTMETDKKFRVILPKKVLSELASTLESSTIPSINLEVTNNHAFINFGKYTYQTGILVGSFPNYKMVVDAARNNNDICFRMNRSRLQNSVERCLIFAGSDQGYGINFDFTDKDVSISAANERGDHAYEVIESESDFKYGFSTRFNGEFLVQYLNTVQQDDSVDLYINSKEPLRPIHLRSQSERNRIFLFQPMERL